MLQTFFNLQFNPLYTFTVTAVNGAGEGPMSSALQVYAATVASSPLNLAIVYQASNIVIFSWEAPVTDGDSIISDY